ncbi:MAG: aldehyde dehydrogenase family protein [Rhodothermales bacterium]|nr:aldehyde dehydrogenase family protein [Rhodothermales bacterium]
MTAPTLTPSIDQSIRRLAASHHEWRAQSPRQRSARVASLRRAVCTAQTEIAASIADDTGKSAREALMQEVTAVLDASRHMERHYPRWLRPRRFRHLRPGFWLKSNEVQFDGLGIVAIIGPGNFPFSLVLMQSIAALLCGNSVVIKPSERAPRTAAIVGELLENAGLSPGRVRVIRGGPETALQLARHPGVAKVLFTGGTEAGRQIARECGKSMKPCVLELGGNAAAIVCRDANVRLAARGIHWSATYARGESCVGTRRVFVHRDVAGAFSRALEQEAGASVLDTIAIEQVVHELEAVQEINAGPHGLSASIWSRGMRQARRLASDLQAGIVWINDVAAGMPQMPWGGTRGSGWGRLYARAALPELTHLRCVSAERRFTAAPKFWWYPYTESKERLVRIVNRVFYGGRPR